MLCCSISGITAQEVAGQLPSDETKQDIQSNYSPKITPLSKPGGGPGLGEVETPVPDYNIIGLLIVSLTYIAFRYNKKRN